MSFSVRFLYGYSVDVVVGAERDYFEVWRDIVHYATSYAVHVKVVGVHKCHTAQQKDSAADFAQRLIRRREVHSND